MTEPGTRHIAHVRAVNCPYVSGEPETLGPQLRWALVPLPTNVITLLSAKSSLQAVADMRYPQDTNVPHAHAAHDSKAWLRNCTQYLRIRDPASSATKR